MSDSATGLDKDRLAHLKSVIEKDIADDKYFGAVIAVARYGELGMLEAIGWGDQKHKVPLQTDSVFSLLSMILQIKLSMSWNQF